MRKDKGFQTTKGNFKKRRTVRVLFVYESDIEDQSVKEHVDGAMANIISQLV
jgi:hypothetical protein